MNVIGAKIGAAWTWSVAEVKTHPLATLAVVASFLIGVFLGYIFQ